VSEASTIRKGKAYVAIGALGLALSVGYVVLAMRLPFGQMDQPGAALFPLVVGALFALASVATLYEGWLMDPAEQVELPVGPERRRLLTLLGYLVGYLLLLPWLGQLLASLIVIILMVRLLSDYSWPRVVAAGTIMTLIVYGTFIYVLKVPMPRGVLWS
jgi:putative tricarboxylic transport membrane protein